MGLHTKVRRSPDCRSFIRQSFIFRRWLWNIFKFYSAWKITGKSYIVSLL